MELDVKERLALLDILPREGDFLTIRIVRELREQMSFSSEEHEAFGFTYNDAGQVTWSGDAEQTKEISLSVKARRVVEDALQKADKEKKLTADHVSVYEKFFPEEKEQEHGTEANNGHSDAPIRIGSAAEG